MSKVMLKKTYEHIINNVGSLKVDINNGIITTAKDTNGYVDNGYLKVKLCGRTILVHQIIAVLVYGEKCIGKQINHKDGNKLNNKPSNLEVCTQLENLIHQREKGLISERVLNQPRKLNEEQVLFIFSNSHISNSELGRMFGVSHTTISKIRRNLRYKKC